MNQHQPNKYYLEKIRQLDAHLSDSDKFRDKVLRLEIEVDMIKKQVMRNAVVGGIIGALIGSGAAPAITHFVEFLIKAI